MASNRGSQRGKAYSQRSKTAQRSINRQINRQYGETRADRTQALKDLREGKWHPFSRDKAKRLAPPQRLGRGERTQEERAFDRQLRDLGYEVPEREIPRNLKSLDRDSLESLYVNRMNDVATNVGKTFEFNIFNAQERAGKMTREQLEWTINAKDGQIRDAAARKVPFNPWHYH